jgi:hypothetical protein
MARINSVFENSHFFQNSILLLLYDVSSFLPNSRSIPSLCLCVLRGFQSRNPWSHMLVPPPTQQAAAERKIPSALTLPLFVVTVR